MVEASGGRSSRGGMLEEGGIGTVARGPRLENVARPEEKGNGPSTVKQCRAAAVN
jgi:hypothetical protein